MDEIKRLRICDQPHTWYEHIYSPYYHKSPHTSKHLFDIYSLTHVFWLIPIGRLGRGVNLGWFSLVMGIFMVLFEIMENTPRHIIKYQRIEMDASGDASYRGDSSLNVIGDLLSGLAGLFIGYTCSGFALVMIALFAIITYVVGLDYWTNFFRFIGVTK